MAIGMVLGLDQADGALATGYFEEFPIVPPHGLEVTEISEPSGPATLETLMTEMLNASERNFLVVAHSSGTGEMLLLGMANRDGQAVGGRVGAAIALDNLRTLVEAFNREQVSEGDMRALDLTKDEIKRLIQLIKDLSRRRPNVIEFRGCNLGRSVEMVSYLRLILSAKWIGAPDLYSVYGKIAVSTGAWAIANHARFHGGPWYTYRYPLADPQGECLLCSSADGRSGHLIADSSNTLTRWTHQYLGMNVQPIRSQLAIHFLWALKQRVDLTDPLAGIGQPEIYLPLQPQYGRHIVYA